MLQNKQLLCPYQHIAAIITLMLLLLPGQFQASIPVFATQIHQRTHRQQTLSEPSSRIITIAQQVFLNIRAHGWNPQAQTRGLITGGLFVNWQMDNPSHTNSLRLAPGQSASSKHDPQTDLYYLTDLAEYKFLHPTDHSFDSDINRILPLIKWEYSNYNLPKGWIYFYLLRNSTLLNDDQLQQDAYKAASNFYTHWYDQNIGLLYNRAHTPGVLTPEHSIACSVALIDAGQRWKQPAWIQAGQTSLDKVLTQAYNTTYNLFYNQLAVQTDGTSTVTNYQAKAAAQGAIAKTLIIAYMLTHNTHYLSISAQLLQSLFSTSHLWDLTRGGFFFALDLNSGRLEQKYKETRAQDLVLMALYRYNQIMQQLGITQSYLDKQQQLLNLISNNFYQSVYYGYFYRLQPDFQIYVSSSIGVENIFTTEAMGLSVDALQQTEFTYLPF